MIEEFNVDCQAAYGQLNLAHRVHLKVVSVSDWHRSPGRLFHSLGPAAAKLRSPSFVLVRGTTNVGTLAERSRLLLLTSLANLHLPCKYVGASPREIWYINIASLKSIRRLTGNQCSCLSTGVMCSRLPVCVSSRAAAFWTDCSFLSRVSVMPQRAALQ